ncbi:MAG: excinuclease ABC subunit C [Desulfobacteraceae bacterium 4572_130]|nr:MAG: excinuclease ABC subunit C [Desulfobacteraceae bacterium 4572_130]
MNKIILEKYKNTPVNPGVYLMKNKHNSVIYVGKALNLKKRLGSYFTKKSSHDLKTNILIEKISDFNIIVTSTEHEALILESNLIKKHKPKYNIILKDNKNYPCLKIDITQKYPFLEIVRKIKNDKALYFGPYSSVHSVRTSLKTVDKIFKLRKCKKNQFSHRSRPCLNFQIKSCLGPCCNNILPQKYNKIIKNVVLFLKGKAPELIRNLKQNMKDAAQILHFEKAAQLRDTIVAIEKSLEKQVVVSTNQKDKDVVSCVSSKEKAVVTILFVRAGNLVGTRHYVFPKNINKNSKILNAFIRQYYEKNSFMPCQILLSENIENKAFLENEFSLKKGKKVLILVPQRGEKKRIIALGLLNGKKKLEKLLSREVEIEQTLIMVQKLFLMDKYPERIECFDNSNIGGTNPVSSMIVFSKGVPDKKNYRKFIIKNAHGYDDYACMKEVLKRRFAKNKDFMKLPDLLLVDGGRGQLGIAQVVLKDLELENKFQIAGIAKKNSEKKEQDKIYIPKRSNPINTNQAQKALFFLMTIRDEAHRFAITFHKKRRAKQAELSILNSIPEIGEKRKAILLKTYKGITNLKKASVKELATIKGMTQKAAKEVVKALKL